jgi:hypothetical protein
VILIDPNWRWRTPNRNDVSKNVKVNANYSRVETLYVLHPTLTITSVSVDFMVYYNIYFTVNKNHPIITSKYVKLLLCIPKLIRVRPSTTELLLNLEYGHILLIFDCERQPRTRHMRFSHRGSYRMPDVTMTTFLV